MPLRSQHSDLSASSLLTSLSESFDVLRFEKQGEDAYSRDGSKASHKKYFSILRFPILLVSFLFVATLLLLYVTLRLVVAVGEKLLRNKTVAKFIEKSRIAKTYKEWRTYNEKLDRYEGNNSWKLEYDSEYYNNDVVSSNLKKLREILKRSKNRKQGFTTECLDFVKNICNRNLGGITNFHLYTNTRVGTKKIIHEYVHTLEQVIKEIMNDHATKMSTKKKFIQHLEKSYGNTALVLSGGAQMGLYHMGVIKALLEKNLLPNIVSGTSAGSYFAALIATLTEDELLKFIDADHFSAFFQKSVFDDAWTMFKRVFNEGVLFDSDKIEKCWTGILGGDNITFLEAYNKTGKVLNINCTSSNKHDQSRNLNHTTTPNCTIASAISATQCIPYLFRPAKLKFKNHKGEIYGHDSEEVWLDGGFKNDLNLLHLAANFHVDNFIVSQVNPHVVPSFFFNRGAPGKPADGWRGGFFLSCLETFLKLELTKWVHFINQMEMLPHWFGQDMSNMFTQDTLGEITIIPPFRLADYTLFSLPSPELCATCSDVGRVSAYSCMSMIEISLSIERTIKLYSRVMAREKTTEDKIVHFHERLEQKLTLQKAFSAL